MTYEFSLFGEVSDEQALLTAAMEAASKEGLSDDDARSLLIEDGKPKVTACLSMILDPGSIPGFEIHDSNATAHQSWEEIR